MNTARLGFPDYENRIGLYYGSWNQRSTVFPYTVTKNAYWVDWTYMAQSSSRFNIQINNKAVFDCVSPIGDARNTTTFFLKEGDVVNYLSVGTPYKDPSGFQFEAYPLI